MREGKATLWFPAGTFWESALEMTDGRVSVSIQVFYLGALMVIERKVLMSLIMIVDLFVSHYRSVSFDYVMSYLFLLIFFDLKLSWSDNNITRFLYF